MSFQEETMLNAYERQLILFYLCNAASRSHYASPEARNLVDWGLTCSRLRTRAKNWVST